MSKISRPRPIGRRFLNLTDTVRPMTARFLLSLRLFDCRICSFLADLLLLLDYGYRRDEASHAAHSFGRDFTVARRWVGAAESPPRASSLAARIDRPDIDQRVAAHDVIFVLTECLVEAGLTFDPGSRDVRQDQLCARRRRAQRIADRPAGSPSYSDQELPP